MVTILLAIAVFLAATAIDYSHARYTKAVQLDKVAQATMWSVLQWSAATVAFVVAVKISLWLLPFEVLGLAVGTVLGMRRSRLLAQSAGSKVSSDIPGPVIKGFAP